MASDIHKHLDRAKRFLEKNRAKDGIEAYWRGFGIAALSKFEV